MNSNITSLGFRAILSTSALALTMGLTSAAYGQSTVSTIQGTVTTDTGSPISGAAVQVRDTRTGELRGA